MCWIVLRQYLLQENVPTSAAKSRATCRNCDGDDCSKNILEDILREDLLTSGYFGIVPLVSTKPKGNRLRINTSGTVSRLDSA